MVVAAAVFVGDGDGRISLFVFLLPLLYTRYYVPVLGTIRKVSALTRIA